MMRGTTPIFRFYFANGVPQIDKAVASFACNRTVLVRKIHSEIEINEKYVCVRLSQEETMRFPENSTIEIQLALSIILPETTTPLIWRSKIWRISSERILEREIL